MDTRYSFHRGFAVGVCAALSSILVSDIVGMIRGTVEQQEFAHVVGVVIAGAIGWLIVGTAWVTWAWFGAKRENVN